MADWQFVGTALIARVHCLGCAKIVSDIFLRVIMILSLIFDSFNIFFIFHSFTLFTQ